MWIGTALGVAEAHDENTFIPGISCLQAQAIVSIKAVFKPGSRSSWVFNPNNYSSTLFVAPPCGFQDVSFEVTKTAPQVFNLSGTNNLIKWDAKSFDTTNAFSLATGKFQPRVAGKYLITAQAYLYPAPHGGKVTFRKNGTTGFGGGWAAAMPIGMSPVPQLTRLVEMNGTTDYLQFYVSFWEPPNPVQLAPAGATNITFATGHLTTAICP